MSHHFYIVQYPDGILKIGCTYFPDRRIREIGDYEAATARRILKRFCGDVIPATVMSGRQIGRPKRSAAEATK